MPTVDSSPNPWGWAADLPTFDGLFPQTTASQTSLIQRFSIFNLFRSSTPASRPAPSTTHALPDPLLLDPLFSLDTASISSSNNNKAVRDALAKIGSYATQLKAFLLLAPAPPLHQAATLESLGHLVRAYLHLFYISALSIDSASSSEAYTSAQEQAINGVFLLRANLLPSYPTLPDVGATALDDLDASLLACVFPPAFPADAHRPLASENLLTPLFTQSRALLAALQAPSRPIAGSKSRPSASSPSHATLTDDDAVLRTLHLLDTFVRGMEEVESLGAPREGGKRREMQEGKMRALRVGMEARLMRGEIGLAMGNLRISDTKRRASEAFALRHSHADDTQEGQEVEKDQDREEGMCERERSGSILAEVQELGLPEDPEGQKEQVSIDVVEAEAIPSQDTTRWEDVAERGLIECLEAARQCLLLKGGGALVDEVTREDWLGELPSPRSPTPRSPSPLPEQESEEDEAEDEDEDEDEEDDDSNTGPTHACPLRTLFRLHDKYEEQRLAVWLSLPMGVRGKMTVWMRGGWGDGDGDVEGSDGANPTTKRKRRGRAGRAGSEVGMGKHDHERMRVGEAWDALGLLLLREYDGDTLEALGLSGEKLDRWTELASRRNAKRVRRARQTI